MMSVAVLSANWRSENGAILGLTWPDQTFPFHGIIVAVATRCNGGSNVCQRRLARLRAELGELFAFQARCVDRHQAEESRTIRDGGVERFDTGVANILPVGRESQPVEYLRLAQGQRSGKRKEKTNHFGGV